MEKEKVNELILKYNQGLATQNEILVIEKLVESNEIDLTQLASLHKLDEKITHQPDVVPSIEMDHRFYEMLGREKRKATSFTFSFPEWDVLLPRLALGCLLILVGFLSGVWIKQPTVGREVTQLTLQVAELKEMMMISLLEKESATERLKAVSLTQEITDPSKKVTAALLKTLNADPNVNVRLAALDALQGYVNRADVRIGLVRSIALQESPLVQLALAELMAVIQEKSSVSELKKVLDKKETPKEVKEKIKKSLDVLI